ncbi:S8 family serine peptidase [Halorarius litoreus]|uniref:S8 family serine peptidase n=1 Tax=Halorarius litoreus TaxID=2962676 RepID=UPI0020CBD6D5|nr:S8 family serine peptidase [Halorarius litoreus]
MRREATACLLLAVLVVAAPVVALSLQSPEPAARDHTTETFESLGDRLGVAAPDPAPAASVDHEVQVVVELKDGATVPRDQLVVDRVYSRRGARILQGTVPLSEVRALSRDPRITAIQIQSQRVGINQQVSPGVAAIGADELHERGLRGENVAVGIIDRGFRPSDPEIAGNIGAYSSFDAADDEWVHGTAVASVVVDTAPNATLHLAAVGPTTTPDEYRRAVSWLRASGADVILDSGSYFGQPTDGTGELSQIVANASEDVVFVTAAGNYAQRHWAGSHDGTGEPEWVQVGADEGNALGNGTISGRVSVGLQWNEWPTATDYDLYLMRAQPGDDVVVAASTTRQDGDDDPVEHLQATVAEGRYYVAIRAVNATGSHTLELFANRALNNSVPAGSLTAPATAPGVLTVGAIHNDSVAAYSSQGPVGTRLGVDVVAPDSVAATAVTDGQGTSYAAPYVAGLVALLESEYPELTPEQHRGIVRSSAIDVGQRGPDIAAGYGRVDARTAYLLAVDRARFAPVDESESE